MLPSPPPLSSTAPVGLQVSAYTIALGSLQACRRCPLDTSQTKISPLPPLPLPPLASRVPSELQATLMTPPRCPRKPSTSLPADSTPPHTRSSYGRAAPWAVSCRHHPRWSAADPSLHWRAGSRHPVWRQSGGLRQLADQPGGLVNRGTMKAHRDSRPRRRARPRSPA